MKLQWHDVEEEYTRALLDYLRSRSEVALQRAYELGRTALNHGLGVVDMAVLFQRAFEKFLAQPMEPGERAERLSAAGGFLVETLGPFEMALRGFRETNTALLRLNERLEEEAKRIAHALHDESAQLLALVRLPLEQICCNGTAPQREGLQKVCQLLDHVEEQLRRLSHELRPTILDDLGLVPALEFLADGVSKRVGLTVCVDGPRDSRLPFLIETSLYRIVQEALTNVTRHAQATRVSVQIVREPHAIRCSVKDDGIGFDLPEMMARKGGRGLGLLGIRERVEALGGELEVNSGPGKGTELSVTIPLVEAQHAHSSDSGR